MGRRKQNKRRGPAFVPLPFEMINHKAYHVLPPSAAKALPYFMAKVKVWFDHPERYHTKFPFSHTEANKYGFANGTFAKVIRDLVRLGFIDPVSKGGLRGSGKSCNMFRLSCRWKAYGTAAFIERRWETFI